VLRGGLALDPGARPPSASEFARDLARAARLATALESRDCLDEPASLSIDEAALRSLDEPASLPPVEPTGDWFFDAEPPAPVERAVYDGWMGQLSPSARYLVAALLVLVATNVITLLLLALGQEAHRQDSAPPVSASARR
jgi:hypothetical protein